MPDSKVIHNKLLPKNIDDVIDEEEFGTIMSDSQDGEEDHV